MTEIYRASPMWMQEVMVSAYGFRLRSLRYGRTHRRVLEELRASQWWPLAKIQEYQKTALTRITALARGTVPLYQDRGLPAGTPDLDGNWLDVPLLQKQELRAAGNRAVSTGPREGRAAEVHTGGTTGTPLTVLCDSGTLQRNYAFFERFREWAGAPTPARTATFAGRIVVPPEQTAPPFWRRNAAANATLFSSYHIGRDTVESYSEALARLQPELIDAYPSSLEPIARFLVDHEQYRVRPRAVVTSSETLLPETRALLMSAFQCPVFDHYGMGEMAALITQCHLGSYHVNPEFGLVELLRDGRPVMEGETGEIVATGFINPIMPLIRYATGDLATREDAPCGCGRAFPVVSRLEGRRDDVLVSPDGRRIGRLDPIFKSVTAIWEAQVIQDRADHVFIDVVADPAFDSDQASTLLRNVADRVGPAMRLDLRRVAQIPRTRAGKFRAVVNIAGEARPQVGVE